MPWINNDGLVARMGREESAVQRGGALGNSASGQLEFTFYVNYTDMLSATASILGAASGTEVGSLGVYIPKGLFVEEMEVLVETAFTSSGTIGSSTLLIGVIREDRSTTYDDDGFSAAALTGTVAGLATLGTKTVLRKGSTGAGALMGTVLANDGVIQVSNSAHATHPFTAGRIRVRIRGYYP
jgi:hypothetical protein